MPERHNQPHSLLRRQWLSRLESWPLAVTPELAAQKVYRRVRNVMFVLLLAVLANGLWFWLQKVGWANVTAYAYFLDVFADYPMVSSDQLNQELFRFTSALYQHPDDYLGGWQWLKRVKDLVWLLPVATLSWLVVYGQRVGKRYHPTNLMHMAAWLLLALLLVLIYGIVQQGDIKLAATGCYGGLFVWVAFFYSAGLTLKPVYLQRLSRWLCQCLLLFLLMQSLMAGVELYRGLHLFNAMPFGLSWGGRVVGSMLQPASLGITTALALFCVWSIAKTWLCKCVALGLASFLIVFSGSAMAALLLAVGLAILLALPAFERLVPIQHRRLAYGLLALVLLIVIGMVYMGLPNAIGRPDLWDSLTGRWHGLQQVLAVLIGSETAPQPFYVVWFGEGLGFGTNAAYNLGLVDADGYTPLVFLDSTISVVLLQFGVVGLVALAALVAWFLVVSWQARQYGLLNQAELALNVMLVVSMLTINIIELFPVNVLFGLMLARAWRLSKLISHRDKMNAKA